MLTFARQQQRRNVRWLLSLSLLVLLATFLSLCAGEQWIAPGDWLSARGELFCLANSPSPNTGRTAGWRCTGLIWRRDAGPGLKIPLLNQACLASRMGLALGLLPPFCWTGTTARMGAGSVRYCRSTYYYIDFAGVLRDGISLPAVYCWRASRWGLSVAR
ncbi:vtamin B12-transporter permease [Salmonella bongori]|nr:vtamin B12-transporter permease [Salmonella bongori]